MSTATPKVIEVTVQEWVDALKSGKFKQTTEVLLRNNSYCCLGVLCRIGGAKFHRDTHTDGYGPLFFFERGWEDEDGEVQKFELSGAELVGDTLESFDAAERKFKTPKRFTVKSATGKKATIDFFPEEGFKIHVNDRDWSDSAYSVRSLLIYLNDDGFSFEEIASIIPKLLRPNAKIKVSTKR